MKFQTSVVNCLLSVNPKVPLAEARLEAYCEFPHIQVQHR